jgi:hypothetical protein
MFIDFFNMLDHNLLFPLFPLFLIQFRSLWFRMGEYFSLLNVNGRLCRVFRLYFSNQWLFRVMHRFGTFHTWQSFLIESKIIILNPVSYILLRRMSELGGRLFLIFYNENYTFKRFLYF